LKIDFFAVFTILDAVSLKVSSGVYRSGFTILLLSRYLSYSSANLSLSIIFSRSFCSRVILYSSIFFCFSYYFFFSANSFYFLASICFFFSSATFFYLSYSFLIISYFFFYSYSYFLVNSIVSLKLWSYYSSASIIAPPDSNNELSVDSFV
jgi:hypothetical protein